MGIEKLLLLSCRSPFLDDSKIYPPLANLYLKSFLNAYTSLKKVTLGDDNYPLDDKYPDDEDKFRALIDEFDAIGISIMTPQREEATKLLKRIKEYFPDKIVIAGGPHVKHYLDDVIKQEWDFIVPLDGEKPLLKIMSGMSGERVLKDVMSKADILNQPRPDRTSRNARQILEKYNYSLGGRKATTMLTARGCPEQCTFCEDALTPVKWSSLDSLKAQMDDIKRLDYGGVYIFDDLFAIAMKMVRPITEELSKRDLIYRCNAQARYFTKWGDEFARLLSDTGCYEIAFGAETGSQKILDNIKKRTTVEQNYKTVEYAKKFGIKVKAFILLGLPGETFDTLMETEKFIANAGFDDFQCAIYYPYKGTQIRDAIDGGSLDQGLMFQGEGLGAYGQKGGTTEAVVRTELLSSDALLAFRNYLVKKYKPESHGKFFDTHLVTGTS